MRSPDRDPYSALRHPGYRSFVAGNFLANIGRQALSLAVAWQIYRWTNSATALGLVGLTTVLPLIALVIPSGVLADRHDRRRILMQTSCASAVLSLGLVLCTSFPQLLPNLSALRLGNAALRAIALRFEHHVDPTSLHFDQPALPLIFFIAFLQAAVRVIGNPARAALVPLLVPTAAVSNAVTWNASAFELSTVVGPALGGFLVWASGYTAVYALDVAFSVALAIILISMKVEQPAKPAGASPDALAGLRFIWRHQAILAAISLDLFAVLLGGAIALLPIYGDKILHVDSRAIGWLRAAPALGAITMAFLVTHLPPSKRPGATMLWAVAGFGASITIFAVSRNLWLSLGALYLSGVCDNFSVVVRHSLVQMRTPDSLRGRVTAVNQLFIGSSNEISELRAGLTAAWYGPVVAATAGGIGTIIVVVLVAIGLPALRTVPPLHTLKPEED